MNRGWIKLWRKSENNDLHPLSEQREFTKWEAWLDLLLLANFKEKWWCGKKCQRGELLYSLDWYSKRWKWHRSKVWRFLKHLKKRNAIETVNETQTTRITILNYETYQQDQNANETETEQKPKRPRNASETPANTTKECNNVNNKRIKNKYAEFVSFSSDEYNKLKEKLGQELLDACIDKLNTYKGSKGVKYKSDYHTMHSWVIVEVNKTFKVKKELPAWVNIERP